MKITLGRPSNIMMMNLASVISWSGIKNTLPFASHVNVDKGLILSAFSFPVCGMGMITVVPLFLEGLNMKVKYLAHYNYLLLLLLKLMSTFQPWEICFILSTDHSFLQ